MIVLLHSLLYQMAMAEVCTTDRGQASASSLFSLRLILTHVYHERKFTTSSLSAPSCPPVASSYFDACIGAHSSMLQRRMHLTVQALQQMVGACCERLLLQSADTVRSLHFAGTRYLVDI
jgi:hypothetical protein